MIYTFDQAVLNVETINGGRAMTIAIYTTEEAHRHTQYKNNNNNRANNDNNTHEMAIADDLLLV